MAEHVAKVIFDSINNAREECKYCKPNSINYALGYDVDGYGSNVYCNRGWLRYDCDNAEHEFAIKINYCPMCGRKVEV